MKMKKQNGITLIALIITIIILLILAGITINLTVGQRGILNQAQNAGKTYKESEIRENVELALLDLRTETIFSNQDLTVEYALEKLQEKGVFEEIDQDEQMGIVGGYVVTLGYDENGNVIIVNIQPDGVARIIAKVLTKGYTKGPVEVSVSVKTKGESVSSLNIPEGWTKKSEGVYEVASNGTYKVQAVLESGMTLEKEIVVANIDDIAPTLETVVANVSGLEIKFTAVASDNESGIKNYSYTISPEDGIPTPEGTFTHGETVTIKATTEATYTISVTAIDNSDNMSTEKTTSVTTVDALTMSEVIEKVNANTLQQYIGTKVDYDPDGSGVTWRVFYCEDSSNYFGDGEGTIYLKRDHVVSEVVNLSNYTSYNPTDGGMLMNKMNPMWRDSMEHTSAIDTMGEHCVAWLCDSTQWTKYCDTTVAKYAIGSPSVEMYMRAFNVYKEDTPNGTALVCAVQNASGYSVGANNSINGTRTANGTIEPGKGNMFMTPGIKYGWLLASPGSYDNRYVIWVGSADANVNMWAFPNGFGVCPIVALNH